MRTAYSIFIRRLLLVKFDVTIDNRPSGRIVFKLYDATVPRTARNFRELATGIHGFGYTASVFHQITPGFGLQGGGQCSR